MGMDEPRISVTCDSKRGCQYEEILELTSLAGGGWDDRNVERELKRAGWQIDGDTYICPDCVDEDRI
jgi:hypothetical protein